jgi:hypothetical protein
LEKSKAPLQEAQTSQFIQLDYYAELNGQTTSRINDLINIQHDVALVLDDYHVVEAPQIHTALTFLLDHLLPHTHMILATPRRPFLAAGALACVWAVALDPLPTLVPDSPRCARLYGSFSILGVCDARAPTNDSSPSAGMPGDSV